MADNSPQGQAANGGQTTPTFVNVSHPMTVPVATQINQMSFLWTKLYERAYNLKKTTFQPMSQNPDEKELFLKFNKPLPDQKVDKGPSVWEGPKHLKYVPLGTFTKDEESSKTLYPIIRPDLGFLPKTGLFQRFTQNVYTNEVPTRLEEQGISVQSTGRVPPSLLGIDTAEGLQYFQVFKNMISSEAFRK